MEWEITADDIGSIANSISAINRTGLMRKEDARRQEVHQQNKAMYDRGTLEYDRAVKERYQTQSVLGALQNSQPIPEGVKPSAISSAQTAYAGQKKSEAEIQGFEMTEDIKNRMNEIYAQAAKNGGSMGAYLKQIVPENSVDMQALLAVRRDLNTNDQASYENMQTLRKTAAMQYKDHQGKMSMASQYLDAGNKALAERSLFSAVNETPHPVYIEKNAQGNYDLYYEELGKEKELLSQGANLTLEQALELVGSIPQQHAEAQFTLDMRNAQKHNSEARPITWINDKTGESVEVFQLYDPNNPNRMEPVVFQKDGGRLDGTTPEKLRQQGYRQVPTLKAMKEGAALTKGALEIEIKTLQKDQKSLALVLEPWKNGKAAMFATDADGNMSLSESGRGALQKAIEFYEGNKGKADLSKTDQLKLNKAVQAIKMYKGITDRVASGYGIKQAAPGKPQKPTISPEAKKALAARQKGDLKEYLKSLPREKAKAVIAELRKMNDPGRPKSNAAPDVDIRPSAMGGVAAEAPGAAQNVDHDKPNINPQLPPDPSTWNVQVVPQNGQRVPMAFVDGQPIRLTEEEYSIYKNASPRSSLPGNAISAFKKYATGEKQLPKKGVWQ